MATLDLNINNLFIHLTRGARPNFFYVEISPPQALSMIGSLNKDLIGDSVGHTAKFFIKATDLPDVGVGTIDVKYMGMTMPFVGDPDHSHDHKFSVINEENFNMRNMFRDWIQLASHPHYGMQSARVNYVGSATIHQLNGFGEPIKSVQLVNMFPVKNNKLALSWDDKNKIETFDVDVKFDFPKEVSHEISALDIAMEIATLAENIFL